MEDGSPPDHRSPLSLGEYSSQIDSGRKLLGVIHRPQRRAPRAGSRNNGQKGRSYRITFFAQPVKSEFRTRSLERAGNKRIKVGRAKSAGGGHVAFADMPSSFFSP